ncbi:MAG TPA: hypothetical protein VJT84_11520 [Gaiellaceae bacterium]|nr:hypothetical protein [Gaiellaceae bacterium]
MWEGVRRDWRTAPVDERLRAMLGFLEKLTLQPEELTREDAEAVRAAGVSDDAIVDAIHVAALFNMIVRLADSLGWDVPPWEAFYGRAEAMLASGYAFDSR